MIDFAAVNAAALPNLPTLLSQWLPGGRREGHEWVALNPRRADRRAGSFRINMESGKWGDFATGDQGGDPISLFAYLTGAAQAEAARALAERLGGLHMQHDTNFKAKPDPKAPITPVPDNAPPMNFRHPKFGEPTRTWPYHDAGGRLIGYVARFDYQSDDGRPAKAYLPLSYCQIGEGRFAWRAKGIPDPRPLYNLPGILSRSEATILVAEGEKTADAAAILFPDMAATTPPHGAKSPHKADWSALAGRKVVIATDNDEAGQAFGEKVCELARAAGAASVERLAPDRLGAWVWSNGEKMRREGPIPKGWDLADALAEGWTDGAVTKMREDPAFFTSPHGADAQETTKQEVGEADQPQRFRITKHGVEKRTERTDRETGAVIVGWRRFCSLLEIVAETRSAAGEEWGRLLRITDRDGRVKEWSMPMSMTAGDGAAYRAQLLSLGLVLEAGRNVHSDLHEYISATRPGQKARCVSRIGWGDGAFIFPRTVIGDDDHA